MKIIFFLDDFPPEKTTSIGILVQPLAKLLAKKGHNVFIVTTTQDKANIGKSHSDGLTIFRVYSSYKQKWRAYLSLYNPRTVKRVEKIIKEINPDICHFHHIHYHLSYALLKKAKKSGAKVFITIHDVMPFAYGKIDYFIDKNDLSIQKKFDYKISFSKLIRQAKKRYNPFRNLLIRYYLGFADNIFAVSNSLKEALGQNKILNVTTLYNFIDLGGWKVKPQEIESFKSQFNLGNKKIILFGGRLSGAKGGKKIIEVLELLVKKQHFHDVVLLVVGDVNYFGKKMLELAQNLGVRKNIVFTGWLDRSEIKKAFFACDICVVPSVCFDSFNLFNIEAMTARKPVIGTCFGGTPEIIKNNKTGYIVNPLNIEMLAEKITQLLLDKEKRSSFGSVGYGLVENTFSLKAHYNKLMSFYKF